MLLWNLLFVVLAAFIIGAYSCDEEYTEKTFWLVMLNIFSLTLNGLPVVMALMK